MTQGPDIRNEYNGCVAVDAIEFENCNLPEGRDNCEANEFHCEETKVSRSVDLEMYLLNKCYKMEPNDIACYDLDRRVYLWTKCAI